MTDFSQWCEVELTRLRQEMEDRFEALCLELGLPEGPGGRNPILLAEDETGLTLSAKLPGVDPTRLEVVVGESQVAIEGSVSVTSGATASWAAFRRELRLPFRIRPEASTASYTGEMLVIRMPRQVRPRPTRIAIVIS